MPGADPVRRQISPWNDALAGCVGLPGDGLPSGSLPRVRGAPLVRCSGARGTCDQRDDAVEGPHDDGATRSADAASRSDDGARTAEETDRNANRRRLAELLEKIEAQLWADTSLNDGEREDLLVDVGNLRSQLTKSVINSPIVRTLIRPLTEIESVCELATDMSDLLRKVR